MTTKSPEQVRREINKKMGRDVIFAASDDKFKLERIPTGILSLDILLNGGLPMGRWMEIYGEYSTLKTSIACYGIASSQRRGFPALYCDVERSITKDFLEMRGVDTSPSMLDVVQCDTGEEYIEVVKAYLQGGLHKVIVLDSIAAMLSNREAKMDLKNEPMGAGGLLTSRMTRILTSQNKNNACIIMVNQTREKMTAFGDNTTTPGGKAPKFYAGQRLRLTTIKNERTKEARGKRSLLNQQIVATLEKDKTSGNYGRETIIHYSVKDHTINHSQEALGLGVSCGIIKRAGNTYSYRNKKYSRVELINRLNKNGKALRNLQQKILEQSIK